MSYDRNNILDSLTIENVYDLLTDLGGEPDYIENRTKIVSRTICHNNPYCGTRKLYYFSDSKTFHCYTDCGENFSIFDLITKIKNRCNEKVKCKSREGIDIERDFTFSDSVYFIGNYFNFKHKTFEEKEVTTFRHRTWKILDEYNSIKEDNEDIQQEIVLEEKFDIIKNYPIAEFSTWKSEGILLETLVIFNIHFDPIQYGVLIPHYDINNRLIGIRIRTMIKDSEDKGKYKPYYNQPYDFSHPLSFNLYGLNFTKDNIMKAKKAIIYEGEKSVLIHDSIFGHDNNISCATCGCTLKKYQVELLISLGVEEIIIAYDKQFQLIGDEEYKSWITKLIKIKEKFSNYCKISFLFDKRGNILNYKSAPIDEGKEKFMELFNQR